MDVRRSRHLSLLLSNGSVLVIGGQDPAYESLSFKRVDEFNATSQMWTPRADMTFARSDFAGVKMPNGNIFVCGGYGYGHGDNVLASCEMYNWVGNTWTAKSSMSVPRYGFTMSLMPSGNVIVYGKCIVLKFLLSSFCKVIVLCFLGGIMQEARAQREPFITRLKYTIPLRTAGPSALYLPHRDLAPLQGPRLSSMELACCWQVCMLLHMSISSVYKFVYEEFAKF